MLTLMPCCFHSSIDCGGIAHWQGNLQPLCLILFNVLCMCVLYGDAEKSTIMGGAHSCIRALPKKIIFIQDLRFSNPL